MAYVEEIEARAMALFFAAAAEGEWEDLPLPEKARWRQEAARLFANTSRAAAAGAR